MNAFVEFAQLSPPQQAKILWEEGDFLLSRRAGSCILSLYALNNFFVEVCYREKQQMLYQITILDSFIRLDACLKVISFQDSS